MQQDTSSFKPVAAAEEVAGAGVLWNTQDTFIVRALTKVTAASGGVYVTVSVLSQSEDKKAITGIVLDEWAEHEGTRRGDKVLCTYKDDGGWKRWAIVETIGNELVK